MSRAGSLERERVPGCMFGERFSGELFERILRILRLRESYRPALVRGDFLEQNRRQHDSHPPVARRATANVIPSRPRRISLNRTPMRETNGAIRTSIQRPSNGAVVAPARMEGVLSTAAMDEAGKSAWCRASGVSPQGVGEVEACGHAGAGRA